MLGKVFSSNDGNTIKLRKFILSHPDVFLSMKRSSDSNTFFQQKKVTHDLQLTRTRNHWQSLEVHNKKTYQPEQSWQANRLALSKKAFQNDYKSSSLTKLMR